MSAISSVRRLNCFTNLLDHPVVRDLLRAIKLQQAKLPIKSKLPAWNLSFVLRALTKPPFEPINNALLVHLTWKTSFLLLLASGRRRGEVLSIDIRRISWTPRMSSGASSVTLKPIPGFLPKVLACAEGQPRYVPMTIPSLTNISSEPEDRLLCPVRALWHYLKRTETHVRPSNRLFVTVKRGGQAEASALTFSAWIKNLIRFAYEAAPVEARDLANIRVHEVRAIAASLSIQSNYSLNSILENCSWATHSTFSSFYLRDLSAQTGEIYSLGPLVTAGEVITTPRK